MENAMKLAVFSGQYFWFDGKHYSTDEAFVKFVTSFYPYFEKIVFCDAVVKKRENQAYILDPATTKVCPLPYFNVYSFWKNILFVYPEIYRVIRDNIHHWNIIWLPGPHPVSLLFAFICWRHRKPFFQMIRANLIEQVRHSNRGIRRYFAMAAVRVLQYASRKLARRNFTFTVGREMYDIYKKRGCLVYETRVSLISDKDIEDTLRTKTGSFDKPVRLLSVGRLDPEKGLHFLIQAVDELIKQKRLDVVLQIAGKGYKGEEERKLHEEVEKRQLTGYVHFLGYVSFGPRLLKLYRESDIFVLPSLTGEGVPQALFEAMACGLPIIATKVAGIPHLIRDTENGLLINAGSPEEISGAVKRLIEDSELRNRLIENGFSTVKNHTLEAERDRMMRHVQEFLQCPQVLP